MKTIVLLGDSITDMGSLDRRRNTTSRENYDAICYGTGYPFLIKAELDTRYPSEYDIYNMGISGNRIVDVYARVKKDCTNLNPDYVSILIGVNDVWHEIYDHNGVETDRFKRVYGELIQYIKSTCPQSKIMLLAPFWLMGSCTCDTEEIKRSEIFGTEVPKRAQAVKELAQEYDLPVVDLQELFDKAYAKSPTNVWLHDGVHPAPAGAKIIADAWLKCFEENK